MRGVKGTGPYSKQDKTVANKSASSATKKYNNRLKLNPKSLSTMLHDAEFIDITIVNAPGRTRGVGIYDSKGLLANVKYGEVKTVRGLKTIIRRALAARSTATPAQLATQPIPRSALPRRELNPSETLPAKATGVETGTPPPAEGFLDAQQFKDIVGRFQNVSDSLQTLQRVQADLPSALEILKHEGRRSNQDLLALLNVAPVDLYDWGRSGSRSFLAHADRSSFLASLGDRMLQLGAELNDLAVQMKDDQPSVLNYGFLGQDTGRTHPTLGGENTVAMSREQEGAEAALRG